MKYCDYFDIDETYFPCIDESAINAGVDWKRTYPHKTFIDLLKTTESMLGGQTKRSIWIHGAYGTGKSQCAYALKRILEVPAEELTEYWDKYEPLKKEQPLLGKLLGHKEKKIVSAYRYASGGIDSPQQLFLAVQESIRAALDRDDIQYKGENTLKESVIAWLEDPIHNQTMNLLLNNRAEWSSLFSQSSADEIINSLRKNGDVSSLMGNIFRMAAKEGLNTLSLDANRLRNWIKDIIEVNQIKIVLVWDEFSDFFRQNKNSLGEFQKVVSICEEAPFYFIIVTHPITSISSDDDSWKIVQQRFDKIEIELPENIAFELIGHAFNVKDAAKSSWIITTQSLESRIPNSSKAIRNAAHITDNEVIRRILPIHPVAALVLKNIANAFQSNQRSMFDFIKSAHNDDVKAFQWFIKEYAPGDDEPFLTVDMLWDFFYVKGKDYLTPDIKLILDTFPQQKMLNEKEQKVLKAVLIMQAIDQRLGGSLYVLKPTDQNLSYAFEGIERFDTEAKNIAKGLVSKGVLISTPIGDGKQAYGAAVLAGDSAKIDNAKADIRKSSTTSKLVSEGEMLSRAVLRDPALKLRYAIDDMGSLPVVTSADFTKAMDTLKRKDVGWHFYAVLALAKDEEEAQKFRGIIRSTIRKEEYKNIIVIDALSSPLGLELFEQYVDYSAMSIYYTGNNNQQAKDNARKAKDVLNRSWRDKIHDGQFYVYTYDNPDGEKATGANNVEVILQTLVLNKYKYVQDFVKSLTETQLKLTQAKTVSRYGMGGVDIKGLIAGCEKSVFGSVWGKSEYWKINELQNNAIVIIKKDIDALIEKAFDATGRISIDEIYDHLEDKFGFSPCNLSAFITGFLLKEYSSDPYRCINSDGYPEAMTPEKLSEMIGNYIGKSPKTTYIVKMTRDEKAFYDATEEAWKVPATKCSSPGQVSTLVSNKMREFGYPVWCLEEVDNGAYDIVKKYIEMVQSDGNVAHGIAIGIGQIVLQKPSVTASLKELLTADKCKEGMELYLKHFDGGKLVALAKEIGAEDLLLGDIKKIFSVKHSALWEGATGQAEIKKLIVEYDVIKQTNDLLNVSCNSKEKMMNAWRDELKFIGFSCEAFKAKNQKLDKFFSYLLKIVNREDFLPDMMSGFLVEILAYKSDIQEVFNNRTAIFCDLYSAYLEGFTETEKEEIRDSIQENIFVKSTTASNQIVKSAAENYRKNQIKTQLFNSWKEMTGTKNPREWSNRYRTPILCLVKTLDYESAKRAFSALNSSNPTDSDINFAIEFINNSSEFFNEIKDPDVRDSKFTEHIVGEYSAILNDIEVVRQALESLAIDTYDWYDSPLVKQKVRVLANAEYNAGGSDKAISLIDSMSDAELKQRLKELVLKDIELGMKIIISGDDKNA